MWLPGFAEITCVELIGDTDHALLENTQAETTPLRLCMCVVGRSYAGLRSSVEACVVGRIYAGLTSSNEACALSGRS